MVIWLPGNFNWGCYSQQVVLHTSLMSHFSQKLIQAYWGKPECAPHWWDCIVFVCYVCLLLTCLLVCLFAWTNHCHCSFRVCWIVWIAWRQFINIHHPFHSHKFDTPHWTGEENLQTSFFTLPVNSCRHLSAYHLTCSVSFVILDDSQQIANRASLLSKQVFVLRVSDLLHSKVVDQKYAVSVECCTQEHFCFDTWVYYKCCLK